MFAHYYTIWMLLEAGPVLGPHMPFFFSLDPKAVTAVLLLFSGSSAENFLIFILSH